jgi:ubiquitin carboxyl-terminal hydrolase L5
MGITILQFENSLRRHNHVGLVHSLLLGLARMGKLDAAIENATEKMKERKQKVKEGKMEVDW